MDWSDCSFAAFDLQSSSLCLLSTNNNTNPAVYTCHQQAQPSALSYLPLQDTYFLLTSEAATGTLYLIDSTLSDSTIFTNLPLPLQSCVDTANSQFYFVDDKSTIYRSSTVDPKPLPLARPDNGSCTAICCTKEHIYTSWETKWGGNIAIFDKKGNFNTEYLLSGVPTNMTIYKNKLYVTFINSPTHGEGLAVFDTQQKVRRLSLLPPAKQPACRLYPCGIIFNNNIGYIINEDSASMTRFNPDTLKIIDFFTIGHSITTLYPLPDNRFAIAGSNMFADLSLLDLVNKKLLSFNRSEAEFSSLLCIAEDKNKRAAD